jgi:hypothetical protein
MFARDRHNDTDEALTSDDDMVCSALRVGCGNRDKTFHLWSLDKQCVVLRQERRVRNQWQANRSMGTWLDLVS